MQDISKVNDAQENKPKRRGRPPGSKNIHEAPDTAGRIMIAAETAKILRVKEHRVHELARLNILPHIRMGRQIRFDRQKIEEFLANGGKGLDGRGGWRKAETNESSVNTPANNQAA